MPPAPGIMPPAPTIMPPAPGITPMPPFPKTNIPPAPPCPNGGDPPFEDGNGFGFIIPPAPGSGVVGAELGFGLVIPPAPTAGSPPAPSVVPMPVTWNCLPPRSFVCCQRDASLSATPQAQAPNA